MFKCGFAAAETDGAGAPSLQWNQRLHTLNESELHIPEGIRFECTGCGNCCMHWPVPLTANDVRKIDAHQYFRALPSGDSRMRGFTHTLEKRHDGRCAFLTEDNRCKLHLEHGIDAKPSMCRLFPYSFTPTPSGTYMYVSFASTGVIANAGKLLSEQQNEMAEQLSVFQELFPHVDADWSSLQLIDGIPLSWDQYLQIESECLSRILDQNKPIMDALQESAEIVLNHVPPTVQTERLPPVPASAETVDHIVLQHLESLYFPNDVFAEQQFDLDTKTLMAQLVQPPAVPTESGGEDLGVLPPESEDLLRRFVYSRIFAKLYLGRSYAHLSLLAGIHHLFFLVCLVRLRIKRQTTPTDLFSVGEILRTLERRMTQMNFSKESCVVLEILLSSPSRLERVRRTTS